MCTGADGAPYPCAFGVPEDYPAAGYYPQCPMCTGMFTDAQAQYPIVIDGQPCTTCFPVIDNCVAEGNTIEFCFTHFFCDFRISMCVEILPFKVRRSLAEVYL
jgi:hypothetical protein